MPNYSFVVDSTFNPYSLEDYIKPYVMYDKVYSDVESGLSELETKANIYERLANSAMDEDTYNMYKSFAGDIRGTIDQLNTYGLQPGVRSSLNQYRARYARDIAPIEVAMAKRDEQAAAQQALYNQDNTVEFDRRAAETKLSDYINNPQLSYKQFSGKALYDRSLQMSQQLRQWVQNNPQYSSILGGQYYQQMIQQGYSPSQALEAIISGLDGPAQSELSNIIKQVYYSSDLDKWATEDQKEQALHNIASGIWGAVGTKSYSNMANRAYIEPSSRVGSTSTDMKYRPMHEVSLGINSQKKGYKYDSMLSALREARSSKSNIIPDIKSSSSIGIGTGRGSVFYTTDHTPIIEFLSSKGFSREQIRSLRDLEVGTPEYENFIDSLEASIIEERNKAIAAETAYESDEVISDKSMTSLIDQIKGYGGEGKVIERVTDKRKDRRASADDLIALRNSRYMYDLNNPGYIIINGTRPNSSDTKGTREQYKVKIEALFPRSGINENGMLINNATAYTNIISNLFSTGNPDDTDRAMDMIATLMSAVGTEFKLTDN